MTDAIILELFFWPFILFKSILTFSHHLSTSSTTRFASTRASHNQSIAYNTMNDNIDDNNNADPPMDLEEEEENFIDLDHAVEVEENDGDMPMDDDDDEEEDPNNQNDANMAQDNPPSTTATTQDMSIQTISSHAPSSVFTVDTFMNRSNNTLSILTGGGDDKAFLHHLDNQNNLATIALGHIHTDSVSSIATNESLISSDLTKTPAYIAVGAYDGSIALYNPVDGTHIATLDGPTDVEFVAFHPKGGQVLLAGSISDATVWMYHVITQKCMQVFVGHECQGDSGGVTDGCFTPDGKFGLTIGMDGSMRIWAPRTGLCRHVFKFHEVNNNSAGGMEDDIGLTCLAVNGGADGQLAIAGGVNGSAYVVHLQGKKIVAKLSHFEAATATATTNEAANNEEEINTSVEAVSFASKAVNPNWVATGGSDGKLKVWDLTFDGGQCRQTCQITTSQTGGITRLSWHPNLPIIIASYSDAAVRLWDARNGSLVHTLTGGGNANTENQINDLSVQFISPEIAGGGSIVVVTGNDDGHAKVYTFDLGPVMAIAAAATTSSSS